MLVMQANGMVSHSAPGQAEPVRSAAPLCIPVVGKVQLSSRLQQLLQRSNELDRLQALQQQQQQQVALGGAGDQPPPEGRRQGHHGLPGPAAASAASHTPLAIAGRPTNGQLKEVPPPPPPPVAAAGTPPHVVSAVGDGFPFKAGCQEAAQSLPAAFTINSGNHQKILPKPVPRSVLSAEPAISYKVDKVKSKHKGAKAAAKLRADPVSSKARPRPTAKIKSADARPASKHSPAETRGARSRVRPPVASPAAPRLPGLPAELRAYQFASQQELAGRRPLLPPPADCWDLESSEDDSETALEGTSPAAQRYRERRRFSRCCRLLVDELRRSGGATAARHCGRLLRPPLGAADSERGRRLRARQRLEARRLLAALQEARDRRRQMAERARLAPLLADAAAAYPSRTGQLLLLPDQQAGRTPPACVSGGGSRTAQLVRRSCCHKGTNAAVCRRTALPCTRHCAKHILYNVDQLLFQHCTAKFSDNTQCCAPVFDIKHELPLCEEHARKRDNYEKMAGKTKSEPKKKSRSIKRPKRRKKTKKRTSAPRESTPTDLNRQESFEDGSFGEMEAELLDEEEEEEEEDEDDLEEEDEDCSEAVGSSGGGGGGGGGQTGELDRSLELHLGNVLDNEFSEVLSKLPDEAFTELFADSHAGDLVHKETEELERALEAVERESDGRMDGQAGAGGGTAKSEPSAAAAAAVAGATGGAVAPRQHVLNGNPSLGGSAEMEESVYSQLAQGISLENAISNVLNGQEMNTLNQLLNHLGDTVIQDADSATISAS